MISILTLNNLLRQFPHDSMSSGLLIIHITHRSFSRHQNKIPWAGRATILGLDISVRTRGFSATWLDGTSYGISGVLAGNVLKCRARILARNWLWCGWCLKMAHFAQLILKLRGSWRHIGFSALKLIINYNFFQNCFFYWLFSVFM